MIVEVSGDILKSKADAIAHGVAPNDDFKQGLALSLRENWPALYKDFRHYCHQHHPKSGTVWFWGGAGGVHIYNLLTQTGNYDHGGHPGKASIENVNHCLRHLHQELEKSNYKSLAMTRLATGVGGLDWRDVRPLIEKQLGSLDLKIIIYATFHAGQVADEGL